MKNRNIPFGYCYDNGTVSIHAKEAEILKQIFEWYIDGLSLLKIAEKCVVDLKFIFLVFFSHLLFLREFWFFK